MSHVIFKFPKIHITITPSHFSSSIKQTIFEIPNVFMSLITFQASLSMICISFPESIINFSTKIIVKHLSRNLFIVFIKAFEDQTIVKHIICKAFLFVINNFPNKKILIFFQQTETINVVFSDFGNDFIRLLLVVFSLLYLEFF